MSATASRPLRVFGSLIAPAWMLSEGTEVLWYSCLVATSVPGVPFGIRRFATSTGVAAAVESTLDLYCVTYTSRRMTAMTATTTPIAIAPPRDVVTFSTTLFAIVRSSFHRQIGTRRSVSRPVWVVQQFGSRRLLLTV